MEMFLKVGVHAFPKNLINSTKNDIEQEFSTQWLSFRRRSTINFKFNTKMPFFHISVTFHLEKGHNQSVTGILVQTTSATASLFSGVNSKGHRFLKIGTC